MKFFSQIFAIVCLSFCLNANAQDYFRLRNNPELKILLDSCIVNINSKEIHEQLAALAQEARDGFGSSVQTWKAQKNTIGNIATAELELIFEDEEKILVPIKSKNGKPYFTTITVPDVQTYVAQDLKESFNVVFNDIIFKNANLFYPDTEVQLADALLLTPTYLEILSESCLKKNGVPLELVVLHIHTELDPCPNCRLLWSTISKLMNKNGSEWLYNHLCRKLAGIENLKKSLASKTANLKNLSAQTSNTKKLQQRGKVEIDALNAKLSKNQIGQKRWTELRDKMEALKATVEMKPRFIVEISSSRKYSDARTSCLDEFSVSEAKKFNSIIDLRSNPSPLQGLPRLAVIPKDYCIFTHFLDQVHAVSFTPRYEVIPGMTLIQLMSEQEMGFGNLPNQLLLVPTPTDLTLQKSIDTATPTLPKTPICGIQNVGNTCYMNSTLQALCASTALRKLLDSATGTVDTNLKSILDAIAPTSATPTRVDIASCVWNIVIELLKTNPQSGLLKNLKGLLASAVEGQQQDASELMEALIGKLASENLAVKNAVTGQMKTTTTGTRCKHFGEAQKQPFTTLSLAIQSSDGETNFTTLNQCLTNFSVEERLTEDNKWQCPICSTDKEPKTYVEATRKTTLTLPSTLIVQLKRFKRNGKDAPSKKLTHAVSYNTTLELDPNYKLKAVIHHHGQSLVEGHYTASVLGTDGKWYTADDSQVTETTFDKMQDIADGVTTTKSVYLLVYEK